MCLITGFFRLKIPYSGFLVENLSEAEIIERYASIPAILNPLAPRLTQEAMTALNWQVDGPEQRAVEEVARTFLQQNNLLPPRQP